jgi:hypothetical protein
MLELLMGGIYHVLRLDGLMWHEMHTKFQKVGTCVRALLRFCLRNINGCNVGITEARVL